MKKSNKRLFKIIGENKGFILFILLMTIFRSALADWNSVPSGSMQPTIVEGDRILVNKIAYDLHLPFSHVSLHKFADPKRGDIVIFDSKVSEIRLVKRVVAIPGDIVQMSNNQLKINGQLADYQIITSYGDTEDRLENLLGIEHSIRVHKTHSRASSFTAVRIPEGFYMALGDNRDNSADSRFIGLIPRNEIIGRTQSVVMSFDYNNFYLPRGDRFLKKF